MLSEPPLDHVFVNFADHLGVHVDDFVVFAENLEGFVRQHELNEELGVSNGEVEFHELVARLTAHPDVSGQLVKGFGFPLSCHFAPFYVCDRLLEVYLGKATAVPLRKRRPEEGI